MLKDKLNIKGKRACVNSNARVRAFSLIALCIAVTACATSRETYTASGEKGYSINCSGLALNWGMCYEKAGDICGEKGFDIIAGGADQGAIMTGTQFGLYGGTVTNRSMVVQCKK